MLGKRVGDFEILDVYEVLEEQFEEFRDEHDDFEYWQEGETVYSAEDYRDLLFGDLQPEQEFTVSKYYGNDEIIVIPDEATQLSSRLFEGNETIKSVIIPNSVKVISDNAFKGCTALEKVKLGEGVTEICAYAFSDCTALKEIEFPSGVTEIRNEAFKGCTGLTQVTIPDGVKTLGEYAFEGCTALSRVHLGNNLERILCGAFKGCGALTKITLPQSLVKVDLHAFAKSGIEEVYIPKSVKDIGRAPFLNCGNLKKIEADAENPHLAVKDNCIVSKTGGVLYAAFGKFTLPNDGTLKKIYFWVFNGNHEITEMDIPEGVTEIYSSAFQCCDHLRRVSLPSTLEAIGDYCFEGTSALEEIVIPAGVEKVASWAFYCSGIKKLVIKRGVKILDFDAFADCTRLTEAYIPSSVYKIDCGLFSGELFRGCNKNLCVYMEKRENGVHTYLAKFLGKVKVKFVDKNEICD